MGITFTVDLYYITALGITFTIYVYCDTFTSDTLVYRSHKSSNLGTAGMNPRYCKAEILPNAPTTAPVEIKLKQLIPKLKHKKTHPK